MPGLESRRTIGMFVAGATLASVAAASALFDSADTGRKSLLDDPVPAEGEDLSLNADLKASPRLAGREVVATHGSPPPDTPTEQSLIPQNIQRLFDELFYAIEIPPALASIPQISAAEMKRQLVQAEIQLAHFDEKRAELSCEIANWQDNDRASSSPEELKTLLRKIIQTHERHDTALDPYYAFGESKLNEISRFRSTWIDWRQDPTEWQDQPRETAQEQFRLLIDEITAARSFILGTFDLLTSYELALEFQITGTADFSKESPTRRRIGKSVEKAFKDTAAAVSK